MRYPRADWAASVPWSGITGKPDGLGADNADVEERLDELEQTIRGIGGGGGSSLTVASEGVELTIGALEPLQSSSETVQVRGVRAGQWVGVTFGADYTWLMAHASAVQADTVRVVVLNAGPVAVSPGNIALRVTYLTNG